MKNIQKLFFPLLVFMFLGFHVNATHLLGGEITWECISSGSNKGKFIFHMKLYRACTGINLGTSHVINNPLYANYGGVATINCIQISVKDLSPPCYDTSNTMNCYGAYQQKIDAIEEVVYQSQPVQINGVPDVGGSDFYFAICCRPQPQYMQNINGNGYWLRAVMFPYTDPSNNQQLSLGSSTTGPSCYDHSPRFAARPATVVCARRPNTYAHGSYDMEADSLIYSWSNPMESSTNSIQWRPLYSTNYQLPTNQHDFRNINPTLDPNTGLISFTAFSQIGGYHSTCVQVSAYKNNQKVAEIYRDIVISILDCNDTILTTPRTVNKKPQISYQEVGSTGPFQSSFSKTIFIGNTVTLDIRAEDLDSLNTSPLLIQSPSIQVIGISMSKNPNDSAQCYLPPCAFLDTNYHNSWRSSQLEFRDSGMTTVRFQWTPSCDMFRLNGQYSEQRPYRVFHFIVKSADNWCPIPAEAVSFFSIKVVDNSSLFWPVVGLDASGKGTTIKWDKYLGPRFNSYKVFLDRANQGIQNPIVTIANVNKTSYFHSNLLKDTTTINYGVQINNGNICSIDNEVRTVNLRITTKNKSPELNWNNPQYNPLFVAGKYFIYRLDSIQNWTLLDSNFYGAESYTDNYPIYNQWIKYKVTSNDYYGLTTISNIDSVKIDSISIQPPNGLGISVVSRVRFIPNPFNSELSVISEDESFIGQKIFIYNILGERVREYKVLAPQMTLDMSGEKPGIYFVRYTDRNGLKGTARLVKTE